ncbi:MAG: glycoside hydrolase family 10 protein [Thermoguttaceae bacterium]
MTQCAVFLVALLAGAPSENVIDDFSYGTLEAARSTWTASEGTPGIDLASDGDRKVLVVAAPFARSASLERVVADRSVELNLAAPGRFELEIAVDPPEACGNLTLYFRSGGGWFGAAGGVAGEGWQTVRFSKAGFRTEGEPAGWDKIDGVRIACWRGRAKDATIRIRRLAACWSDVALVIPTASEHPGDREINSALESADSVGQMLDDLGLGADAVEDATLPAGGLGRRHVAIVAYHPRMPEATAAALVQFVEKGGKVFGCYGLPDSLTAALGFKRGEFHRPAAGTLAEIRFDAADIQGLPRSARQASWNINTVVPVAYGARAIAHWFDGSGKPTGLPAMWVSDRGAYLSHILLDDDPAAKRQMLAAVLGQLDSGLWQQMAAAELAKVGAVGHCRTLEEVAAFVKTAGRPEAIEAGKAAVEAEAKAKELVAAGGFADAVATARDARDQLARSYLLAQESRTSEGRAWWNHSGTGPYPGDWDRACRELAEAGFNMILPNMLWAGRAHYPSDVLPRSETFEQYGDQIEQCLAAAKKYGLEVHAWKVNHNLSGAPRPFVEKLKEEGRLQVFIGGESQNWLCPSDPRNYRLEVDSMLEVARKYDVAGLHFDYIRYPGSNSCFCDGCRERFEADTGLKVENWPKDCHSGVHKGAYTQWRCDQISRLVRTVHDEARQMRPSLKISAAVFGSYPSCRESVAQDWPEWIKAGWLDFVCPMDYTDSDPGFCGLVQNQLELVGGRIPIYPGIGATASRSSLSADRVAGQIFHARRLGAAGFTIFNLSESTARDILPGLKLGATARKAELPHAQK